jgi:hypothetical protein
MRFLPLFFVLAAACGGPPLPEAYVVRDLRVIAFLADPPEVSPGDPVTLTAWFYDPDGGGQPVHAKILRCVDDGDANCVTLGQAPLEVYVEGDAENVSLDLFRLTVTINAPPDALTNAGVLERQYGLQITYVTHAQTSDPTHVCKNFDKSCTDGLKRLVVSDPKQQPKNTNPTFTGFAIEEDGRDIGDDVSVTALSRGTRYVMRPLYDPAVLQDYTVIDFNGTPLSFTEEASFNWSCSPDCNIDQRVTYSEDVVTITPPDTDVENRRFAIQVLMRDGRGGEAILVRHFDLVPQTVKIAP